MIRPCVTTRRNFLSLAAVTAGADSGFAGISETASVDNSGINIIGPKPGYSPQIGTLASMLTWMQTAVDDSTKGLTPEDLEIKKKWDAAMHLGDAGRALIKGHDHSYYLEILKETREKSLAQFAKRDDKWVMSVIRLGFAVPRTAIASGFTFASLSLITADKLHF